MVVRLVGYVASASSRRRHNPDFLRKLPAEKLQSIVYYQYYVAQVIDCIKAIVETCISVGVFLSLVMCPIHQLRFVIDICVDVSIVTAF